MENVVIKDMEKNLNKNKDIGAVIDASNANLPDGYDPEDLITVYGISGIENIKTRECVKDYIDEGEAVLLTLDINGRKYKVRVLKEHPYVGIMIDGHKEGKV